MKKIPTLFQRSEDRRSVIDEVTPGCEWVLRGEGQATRKYDGTCVRLTNDGAWWFRREVKIPGADAPEGFVPSQIDEVTGKIVGWEPAPLSGFHKYLVEALSEYSRRARYVSQLTNDPMLDPKPGTYELCGPKINGNPEGQDTHELIEHAQAQWVHVPLTFSGLRDWLQRTPYEGIVWHHPDGRMCKLKRRDFPKGAA